MQLSYRGVDPNFWRVLSTNERDWSCDNCNESFFSAISKYTECAGCRNHGFCEDCVIGCKVTQDKWIHQCSTSNGSIGTLSYRYMDIEPITDEYTKHQLDLAMADKAHRDAEEKKKRDAEVAKRRMSMQSPPTVQRKAVGTGSTPMSPISPIHRTASEPVVHSATAAVQPQAVAVRAVAASPPAVQAQAQVQHQQHAPQQRRRHSSQTGQFFKAVGVGLVKGAISASLNPNSNLWNSGGGGS